MARWLLPLQRLAVLASFILTIAVFPLAPETVAIHWGLDGQPNNYGDKLEGLFALPLITLGMFGLLKLAPRLDPRRRVRNPEFARAYGITTLAILVFVDAMQVIVLLWAFGSRFNVTLAVLPPLLLLVAVLITVLGRLRPELRRA